MNIPFLMTFLTAELEEENEEKARALVEAEKENEKKTLALVEATKDLASKERKIWSQARAILRLKEKLNVKCFIIESK